MSEVPEKTQAFLPPSPVADQMRALVDDELDQRAGGERP